MQIVKIANTLTTDWPSMYHLGTAFSKESMKDLGSCTKQLPLTAQTGP